MPAPEAARSAWAWCRRCGACERGPSRPPRRRGVPHESAPATRCRCGHRPQRSNLHRHLKHWTLPKRHSVRCRDGVARLANPDDAWRPSYRWTRLRARQARRCRCWVRSNALSRRDPWEEQSLLARAAATALCVARTVCAVQRGRADRERRIRRLTDPLHAPGASATSSTTTNVAAGDQASTRQCTTGARHPEESGVSLVLGSRPMSKATGTRILRRRSVRRGMGQGFDRNRAQRMRRMWTDCTSPNRAKYTISPDPP